MRSSSGTSEPSIRAIGGESTFRWRSDPPCSIRRSRYVDSSMRSSLSAGRRGVFRKVTLVGEALDYAAPGGVPEWPKGTGCKPVGSAFGGSNPPSPTFSGTDPADASASAMMIRLRITGFEDGHEPHRAKPDAAAI